MSLRTRSRSTGASILAALGVAVALILSLGVGSAGAQGLTLAPGSFGGEVGNGFCVNLEISGASDADNLTVAVDSGSLPGGIGIDVDTFGATNPETRIRLAGTPTTVGSSTFVLEVTDDLGTGPTGDDVVDTASFTIDVIAESSADVVIAAGRLDLGYTIDCTSQGREVQTFARDLSNFGPSGTVASRLAIRDHTDPVNDAYLTGVDILLDGWVRDIEWETGEVARIEDWVEAGGVLIAAEDSNTADALGATFGAPTSDQTLCTHTPSEAGDPIAGCQEFEADDDNHPVVTGPFGDWSANPLSSSGTVGWYATDPADWQVIARDSGARATVITRRVGSGRVILVTDEGLWRTQSYGAGAGNGTFIGNLLAYAIDPFGRPELVDDEITGFVGMELSTDLCANDVTLGDTPVDVAISSGTLPAGLSLEDCTITGTPTAAADTMVTYQVTDADGDTGTGDVTLMVTALTCGGETATIVGTMGDDTLRGTAGDDVIVGRGGDDVVRGLGGDDVICGVAGDDTVIAGGGDDRAFGGAGDDTLRGGAGTDRLVGNRGADGLAGGAGPGDRCVGGIGRDTILAGCEIRLP